MQADSEVEEVRLGYVDVGEHTNSENIHCAGIVVCERGRKGL